MRSHAVPCASRSLDSTTYTSRYPSSVVKRSRPIRRAREDGAVYTRPGATAVAQRLIVSSSDRRTCPGGSAGTGAACAGAPATVAETMASADAARAAGVTARLATQPVNCGRTGRVRTMRKASVLCVPFWNVATALALWVPNDSREQLIDDENAPLSDVLRVATFL